MKQALYREGKKMAKMAIGVIIVGCIIKEEWLKNSLFVWIALAMMVFTVIWLGIKEEENKQQQQ